MDLSVVILTRNESGNVGEVVERARAAIGRLGIDAEILDIDGQSSDGTCAEAEAAGAETLHSGSDRYGDALRAGFARARGDYVLTLDSDLSHAPEDLERLWELRERADVVIASRYVPGGRADMSWRRAALSRLLNRTFRNLLQLPVRDVSSGYRLYRREALEGLRLRAREFDVLEEVLTLLHLAGRTTIEIPFHYHARKCGKSHVQYVRFGIAYLKTLWRMRRVRLRNQSGGH